MATFLALRSAMFETPETLKFPFISINSLINAEPAEIETDEIFVREMIDLAVIESLTFNLKAIGSMKLGDPPFHCWSRFEISSSSL